MTDDLERALRDLGARLDVPPTDPDETTAAVLARLDEKPARHHQVLRRLAAAAVAALIALATAMAVSPAVRAAVFDFFRIGAVEIHENQPPPVIPSLEPKLPGEQDVTLDTARARAPFPLKLPAGLGNPGNVRIADNGHVVSLAFDGAFGKIRIDQFGGRLDPIFTKFASAEDVHHVRVGDHPAIWVARPHVVVYDGPDGTRREASARLAANTLIWEADGVTYRVEGELTADQAIAIAESLR